MSTTPPIMISNEPFDIGSDFDFYHHHHTQHQQQQHQQQQQSHPKRIDISSDDILNMFTTFADDPDFDQTQQPLAKPEDAYIASSITSSPSSQSSTRSTSTSSSSSSINKTYKFGKELSSDPLPHNNSTTPAFDPADFLDTSNLKYQIKITEDFPSKSRVETQIKIAMNFYPPPKENMIHLPADTISKPKLQLKEPFKPIKSCLMLDTFVVCDSNLHKFVNICQGCMKRERKRASRKKSRLPIEEAHWQQDKQKRAIVFNCREVIDFVSTADVDVNGTTVATKQLQLPVRMACYCRHHNEKVGFKAFFVISDYTGKVVGRASTNSIMITDDHKATTKRQSDDTTSTSENSHKRKKTATSPISVTTSPEFLLNSPVSQQPSPALPQQPSPAASAVAAATAATSMAPSPAVISHSPNVMYQSPVIATHSPAVSQSPMYVSPSPLGTKQSVDEWASHVETSLPLIQRIIPSSGSIRGGMEVTLLGNNFVQGLTAKFGENRSMSTQCWSQTTIVTHLPPSRVAGPVVVTFEGFTMADPQVFSYYDDTDRQLIELALQVVGLKMNGRLEDARDIARRIVGSTASTPTTPFDSTQIQQLTDYNMGTNIPVDQLDGLLLKCLELIDQCPSQYLPNWQLSNAEGQTMLHLSACLGLKKFTRKLLSKRPALDVQDKSGFTPLHFAALYDQRELIELFLEHGAKPDQRTYTKQTYKELMGIVAASAFEFNDELESSSDEQSDSSESTEKFEPESALDYFNPAKSLASYFASWRESSTFWAEGTANNNEEQYFWNFIYKNLYGNSEVEQKPPSYEEIFPAGSSSGADFSGSVIEEVKTAPETEAEIETVVETEVDTTMELKTSEADVLEAWKNKRKKIQNDGMFLFFWLPVFIFMLVWVSMKLVHIVDDFGIEEKVGYVKDFVKARVVG